MDELAPPSDQGKMWAAVSYAGFFFGLPLGAIPLIMRDDPFALYHAKNATAVWLAVFVIEIVLSVVITVLSVVTCGVGSILYILMVVPGLWAFVVGIHGLILSLNGERKEPIGAMGLGERLFANIKPKDAITGP